MEQYHGTVLSNGTVLWAVLWRHISRSGAVVLVTGKQEAGINLGEILERSILFSWWSQWDYDNDDESWWQIVIDDDEIMTMMSIIWWKQDRENASAWFPPLHSGRSSPPSPLLLRPTWTGCSFSLGLKLDIGDRTFDPGVSPGVSRCIMIFDPGVRDGWGSDWPLEQPPPCRGWYCANIF